MFLEPLIWPFILCLAYKKLIITKNLRKAINSLVRLVGDGIADKTLSCAFPQHFRIFTHQANLGVKKTGKKTIETLCDTQTISTTVVGTYRSRFFSKNDRIVPIGCCILYCIRTIYFGQNPRKSLNNGVFSKLVCN